MSDMYDLDEFERIDESEAEPSPPPACPTCGRTDGFHDEWASPKPSPPPERERMSDEEFGQRADRLVRLGTAWLLDKATNTQRSITAPDVSLILAEARRARQSELELLRIIESLLLRIIESLKR